VIAVGHSTASVRHDGWASTDDSFAEGDTLCGGLLDGRHRASQAASTLLRSAARATDVRS
jgi:hypothetical protein